MILTFYSYKGGVGRTMALVNIAELFFRSGKKVLVVDWDLEAPGMERFFFNEREVEKILETPGIMDMLIDYKLWMSKPSVYNQDNIDIMSQLDDVGDFFIDIDSGGSSGGKLWLLTSGKRRKQCFSDYTKNVLTFNWEDFYENWGGELYFEWLRREFEKRADIILIDSRTGITEMGGVCTYQLSDIVLMLCGTNNQNVDGTYRMATKLSSKKLIEFRSGRDLDLLIIPARVEDSQAMLLDTFKVEFLEKFTQFMPLVEKDLIWDMKIPYSSKYAYTEKIACREGSLASAEVLQDAYEEIFKMIVGVINKRESERSEALKKANNGVTSQKAEISAKEELISNKSKTYEMLDPSEIDSEISILHLSDLYFGLDYSLKKGGGENPTIHEKLLAAIKNHITKTEDPDFVVVTGDIASSGKKNEYEVANEFFSNLKSLLPNNPPFLFVPGNHDVDLKKVDEFFSLHKVVVDDRIDEFLKNKKYIRSFITEKTRAYVEFCKSYNPCLYRSLNDYFWTQNYPDKKVSFCGLNSVWAVEGANDRFNIALGFSQVKSALELSRDEFYKIVLLHHPIDNWLKDLEDKNCRNQLINNSDIILHGHSHGERPSALDILNGKCLCLGNISRRINNNLMPSAFNFVKVQFRRDKSGLLAMIWPYIYDEAKGKFSVESEIQKAGEGKEYFIIDTKHANNEKEFGESPLAPIPNAYREWLENFHSTLPIEQLAKKGEAFTVPLPRVYIPLETANPFHKEEMKRLQAEKEKKRRTEGEDGNDDELEAKEPSVIDIEALLGRQDTVLLRGEPGMGKTTLVRHLAYMVVHWQAKPGLQGYLPVLVFLKDLWPLFEKEIIAKNDGIKFESMLGPYFEKIDCPLGADLVKDYIKQGRAVLLIDGLDEVPDHLRGSLVEKIARFRSKNKKNRFLLTGRPHGINGQVMDRFGKFLQDIEPLDHQKIADFITDWFREVCGKAKGIAEKTAVELIGDISTNEYVSVFVQNPLLLTAVCILYQDNKKLPDQRADLYGRVVDNLLCKRFSDPSDPGRVPRLEAFLMRLAFVMQEKHLKHMEPFGVKEILKEFYPQGGNEKNSEYNRRIDQLFDEIEPNCGLLKRQSSGEVEFFHLTFQEFMAARYMIDSDLDFLGFLPDPWWDETILLYAGLASLHSGREGNRIVQKILGFNVENKDQSHRFCLLGSMALRDMLEFKRSPEVISLSRENLKGVITSHEDPKIRLEAGEILGVFEDDRYTDFEMVEIPAGEFIRGSSKGEYDDDEEPARKIYLDSYLIGKYPVTNREFKEFVDSRGYTQAEFWLPEGLDFLKEEKITEPLYWRDRKWNGSNFPVVGVSWYECEAFCRWLSEKTGFNYRLPTEAEWEKASRSTDGRLWPWGNEFDKKLCNSGGLDLDRTSPIGIFSGGESPYGCMDMAGNVWEWCQDWFEDDYYENSPDKNPPGPEIGDARVLRGGSWISGGGGCRCAYRNLVGPGDRGNRFGFRLARSL